MKVKDLIEQLKVLNPNAEVMVIAETGEDNGYQTVFDCEEEFADLVTIGCGYPAEVITKDKLVKAIKENDTSITKKFKSEDIGQGYGYKPYKDWNKIQLDEVIYIPEVGYMKEDENGNSILGEDVVSTEVIYTKQDFIDIVKDKVKPSRVNAEASALYEMVDWQCPEVLAEELNYDEEYEDPPSDRAFVPEINCRGCRSKCVDKKTGKPACEEIDELCENITWCPKTCGMY